MRPEARLRTRIFAAFLLGVGACGLSPWLLPMDAAAAPLILNEFNAVGSGEYLNGGDVTTDGDGNSTNPPEDSYFGRIASNGGDWIELVVVGDHLDIRMWTLEICEYGDCVNHVDHLVFANHSAWSDLRAGTILTVAEDEPTDLSFNPGSGDWWINVQAANGGSGTYITPENFPASNDDWQLTIYNAQGERVFGPAGEHVPPDPVTGCTPPQDDVNSGEIFRLEQDPSALIDPCRITLNDYEDGVISTFGSPNAWNGGDAVQSFDHLRSGAPYPDGDGDQVPDDADLSGVAGDNPCVGGSTTGCDDNCAGVQNSGQEDTGGPGGPDGMGDACQCGDPTGDNDVTAADLLELRELRVGLRTGLSAPERCSVYSQGQCALVDAVVLHRTLANPALQPGLSPTCRAAAVPADQSELMFDPDRMLEVDIRIAEADWDVLRSQGIDIFSLVLSPTCGNEPWNDPYTFFPSEVTVDGLTLTNVAVRKKGFHGSLSDTKPSFKVKFDEFVGGQQINAMDRLTLNNNLQDPAHITQCLGYALMRKAGIPAPRCNFAHVTVTVVVGGGGETIAVDALYTHVDSIKDPFLRRNFGSDQGRLYEGTLSDFWTGSFRNTIEPKTPEAAADTTEIDALLSVLMDGGLSGSARLTAIQGLVDVDAFLTFWAGEGMIGHWDGYADDQNNFWFYVNPADTLIHFIPWGADDTFGPGNPLPGRTGDPVHADAIVPRAALTRRLYEISTTKSQYLARLQLLMDTVWDEAEIHAEIDRMEALITPVTGSLTPDLNQVRTWVDDHRSHVAAEIASPPAGFSDQPSHFCIFNP
jgi:hypothetical protein